MTAAPPFPEAALRAVLAGTVAAWASAGHGDAASAGDEPRALYLDAFAGAEFQFGTGVARSAADETRAAAAFRALEQAGLAPPPNAVFAEEDPAHLGRVYAELEDAAGERLCATRNLASLGPGDIALVEAPFASVAADIARFAAGARTFALLAPPAARALPWDVLRQIATLPGATLLIRIPHSDLEKQARHSGPLADLPGFAKRIVEGCSAMLDDPKHAWLPAWRADAASLGPAAAMAGVLERFRTLLDSVAAGRILAPLELEAADGARTWLFLLTLDPAVAVAANAAVRAAKLVNHAAAALPSAAAPKPNAQPAPVSDAADETPAATGTPSVSEPAASPADTADARAAGKPRARKPRRAPAADPGAAEASDAAGAADPVPPVSPDAISVEPGEPPDAPPSPIAPTVPAKVRPPVAEALDLFGDQSAPAEAAQQPDPSALAAAVETRFGASTVAWGEVQRVFAATGVTPAELKQALAFLRRAGRATYKALKKDEDEVSFLAAPITRELAKRRRKAEVDDGFFASGEDSSLDD